MQFDHPPMQKSTTSTRASSRVKQCHAASSLNDQAVGATSAINVIIAAAPFGGMLLGLRPRMSTLPDTLAEGFQPLGGARRRSRELPCKG